MNLNSNFKILETQKIPKEFYDALESCQVISIPFIQRKLNLSYKMSKKLYEIVNEKRVDKCK